MGTKIKFALSNGCGKIDDNEPAIIVDRFDKDGKFVSKEVHTVVSILEDPDKYDSRTFWLLIERLSRGWDDEEDRIEAIEEILKLIKKRAQEIKKAREENTLLPVGFNNSEERKKYYFGGKSIKQ